MSLDKKVMLLIYVALPMFAWMFPFVLYVLPMLMPLVYPDKIWLMWLIGFPFVGSIMLALFYVTVRITGSLWQFDRTQWKIAIIGTPLACVFLSGLGYVFSLLIPSRFEPFRSVTLPALVLALVFIIISRMKFIKKYQVTGKQPA